MVLAAAHTDKFRPAVVNLILHFQPEIQRVFGLPGHLGAEVLRLHRIQQRLRILLQDIAIGKRLPFLPVGAGHPFVRGNHLPMAFDGRGHIPLGDCQEDIHVFAAQRANDFQLLIFLSVLFLPVEQADCHQKNAAQECRHDDAIPDAGAQHTPGTGFHNLVDVVFPHHDGKIQLRACHGFIVYIGVFGICHRIHRIALPAVFPVLPDGFQTVARRKLRRFLPDIKQVSAVGVLHRNVQQVHTVTAKQAADGLVLRGIELHRGDDIFNVQPGKAGHHRNLRPRRTGDRRRNDYHGFGSIAVDRVYPGFRDGFGQEAKS